MKGTQKTIIDIYILRDDDSYINHRPGIDTSHNVTHAVAPAPASQWWQAGRQVSSSASSPRGQVSPAGEAISVIGGKPRQTDTRRRPRPRAPPISINSRTGILGRTMSNFCRVRASTCRLFWPKRPAATFDRGISHCDLIWRPVHVDLVFADDVVRTLMYLPTFILHADT